MPCITGKRILAVALAATPANGMNESSDKTGDAIDDHFRVSPFSDKSNLDLSARDSQAKKVVKEKFISANPQRYQTLGRSLRDTNHTGVNSRLKRPLFDMQSPSPVRKTISRNVYKAEARAKVFELADELRLAEAEKQLAEQTVLQHNQAIDDFQNFGARYYDRRTGWELSGQENAKMVKRIVNVEGEDVDYISKHTKFLKAEKVLPLAQPHLKEARRTYKEISRQLSDARTKVQELDDDDKNLPQSQTLEGEGFDYIEPVERPDGSVIMEQTLEDEGFDYIEPVERPDGTVIMEQDNQAQNFLANGPISRNAPNRVTLDSLFGPESSQRNAPKRAVTLDSFFGTGSIQPAAQRKIDFDTLLSGTIISKTSGRKEEQNIQDSSEDLVKQESRVDDNSSGANKKSENDTLPGVNGFTF